MDKGSSRRKIYIRSDTATMRNLAILLQMTDRAGSVMFQDHSARRTRIGSMEARAARVAVKPATTESVRKLQGFIDFGSQGSEGNSIASGILQSGCIALPPRQFRLSEAEARALAPKAAAAKGRTTPWRRDRGTRRRAVRQSREPVLWRERPHGPSAAADPSPAVRLRSSR